VQVEYQCGGVWPIGVSVTCAILPSKLITKLTRWPCPGLESALRERLRPKPRRLRTANKRVLKVLADFASPCPHVSRFTHHAPPFTLPAAPVRARSARQRLGARGACSRFRPPSDPTAPASWTQTLRVAVYPQESPILSEGRTCSLPAPGAGLREHGAQSSARPAFITRGQTIVPFAKHRGRNRQHEEPGPVTAAAPPPPGPKAAKDTFHRDSLTLTDII
jgi:hypothetical protein